MIKLENIGKTFQVGNRQITALEGVNLMVAKGQIYGVIGSSGAGKSTLIRCVNLLEAPTSGKVFVDNQELTALNEKQLIQARRQISMIFQHFNLLNSRNVFDNVALPLELSGKSKTEINKKVTELLELVGLSDKHNAYPANLSGGQKQRVAIARGLATDPKVLLCDEATSALDPATTQAILKLLKDINRELGITILLITHEMDVVKKICDQVAVIDQGQLIEQGTVAEIFSNPQTELAQKFIKSTFSVSLPEEFLATLTNTAEEAKKGFPIVKCEFTGASVEAPVMSQASKRFGIDLSILTSQIDYAGGVKFGITIAELEGDKTAIQQTIDYLTEHQIKVEILGYV